MNLRLSLLIEAYIKASGVQPEDWRPLRRAFIDIAHKACSLQRQHDASVLAQPINQNKVLSAELVVTADDVREKKAP